MPVQSVVIPPDKLSPEALVALVDEFVLREGTEYGRTDYSLEQKRETVLGQIRHGRVLITFDPCTGTTNLVTCDGGPRRGASGC